MKGQRTGPSHLAVPPAEPGEAAGSCDPCLSGSYDEGMFFFLVFRLFWFGPVAVLREMPGGWARCALPKSTLGVRGCAGGWASRAQVKTAKITAGLSEVRWKIRDQGPPALQPVLSRGPPVWGILARAGAVMCAAWAGGSYL